MGRLVRRRHESTATLCIWCALATIGLSACADIWGFDDLHGTRDGGPANLGVTAVPDGAAVRDGAGTGGAEAGAREAGAGGGSGSDAQVSTGGVRGGEDAAVTDGGLLADAHAAEGGQPDAPNAMGPDASRDATVDTPSVGSQDGGQRDAPSAAGQDASRDASVDTTSPTPVAISVDFVGGGTPMALTETAGVFPAARWNSAAGAAGTLAALLESDGSISAAAVTWDGGGVWQLPVPDAPGNTRMMTGYLDPRTTSTVVVSGLPASLASARYDVYVYTNGDVPAGTTRAASYAVGTNLQVVTQPELTPFSGAFIDASNGGSGNYVVFRAITGATLTLTMRPVSGTGLRAPINGLQIVPAGAGP